MGCGTSKLDAPGMIQSWLTQRGSNSIQRRGFSKNQLLSPLEVTPPGVDPQSKSMADEEKDMKIGTPEGEGEGEKEEDIVSGEDEDGGEDFIRRSVTSPSFRVYCLENEDEDEDEDGGGGDQGSVNSYPSKTDQTVVTQQASDNSSMIETSEKKEGKRRRGRDLFKEAKKNLLHLKLPHYPYRRSTSTNSVGSHYHVDLPDHPKQPRSTSQDHDQANGSSHRHRHNHSLPLTNSQVHEQGEGSSHRHHHHMLPHISHHGSHEDGSNHRSHHHSNSQDDHHADDDKLHHHLKMPHLSHHDSTDHEDGSNRRAQSHTITNSQGEGSSHHHHQHRHHHLKLPHLSHHGSTYEDGGSCHSKCDGDGDGSSHNHSHHYHSKLPHNDSNDTHHEHHHGHHRSHSGSTHSPP